VRSIARSSSPISEKVEPLAGTLFQIGRFSGKPIVIEDWDGRPFELP
jgi:hypothetical protein